jgi:serine/threonine protein kinase/Tol biopolymer transport system component
MSLPEGTRLGPYEVLTALGEGGMGAVYRARDTKLQREVAIKVLLPAVAGAPDRLARFRREALLLASLNHPHIAHIYGLEDAPSGQAGEIGPLLVMEFVDGATLADLIARGPLPMDEALRIAQQVASALEAAHEQGIVHRDLKPANIKVRPDGTVKVLDFGLAKALEPSGAAAQGLSMSPTITSPAMTQMGVILGTAAYMSPEQARGRPVDKRADLWAFGCVLYEMLTGAAPFRGEDVTETLAAVVKSDVDWKRLPGATPPAVATLLGRCLRKDPRQRLGDAGAARLEIEDALSAPPAREVPTIGTPRFRTWWAGIAVGSLIAVAGLATALWFGRSAPQSTPAASARLVIPLPADMELVDGASVAISPDGTRLAYVASQGGVSQVYMRSLNAFESRVLAGTKRAAGVFFSPDGQSIGFFADQKLKTMSIDGGVVREVADANTSSSFGSWGPDGTILFRGVRGLEVVSSSGGAVRPLLSPEQVNADGGSGYGSFLPDHEAILIGSNPPGSVTTSDASIDLLNLRTGDRKVLIRNGAYARYLDTGHIVFFRDGALMAVPFDAARRELAGSPVQVIGGVRQMWNGLGAVSCSRTGTCAYAPGSAIGERTVTMVDRAGARRTLSLPPRSYANPRFSPTGDKLSFWIEQLRCDVDVYDVRLGNLITLTNDGDNHFPIWKPDGRSVTYLSRKPSSSGAYAFFSKPVNGGPEAPVSHSPQNLTPLASPSWSPDGTLVYAERGDIWALPNDGEARPIVQTPFAETTPSISPDGHWMVYTSDESGRFEVYVQPFPALNERYPVSSAGGTEPVWSRSGRELFFRSGDQMMVVDVDAAKRTGNPAGLPRILFTGRFVRSLERISYDVSPDGQTFVMLNAGPGEQIDQINVLINWFDELKRLAPPK